MIRDIASRGRGGFTVLLITAASISLTAHPAAAQVEDDAATVDTADIDPVDLNRASLEELLVIPGMTPELARELLAFRAAHGPIRRWSDIEGEGADLTAARLLEVRPWLVLGESAPGGEARAGIARTTTPTRTRDDASLTLRAGWLGGVVRGRRDMAANGATTNLVSGVVRARPARGISVVVGDVTPVVGQGLLLGLRGSFGAEPPLGAIPGESGWRLDEAGDLVRTAPVPGGRFLRGAALDLHGRVTAGSFAYHPGLVGPSTGDSIVAPARWHWAMVRGRVVGIALAAQAARWDAGTWLGGEAGFAMGTGAGRIEWVRDPAGASRWALAADLAGGRRWRATLRHVGGGRAFVAPLSFDSARAPLVSTDLATGRNEDRNLTQLDCRVRTSRRTAMTLSLSGRLDPAGLRRSWDRPVGAGTLGLEVTAPGGWAMAGDVSVESRGSPGPSADADPPERRGSARVKAAWEGRKMRLRFDWNGRLDLERDPAGADNRLRAARDVVSLRGRWRPASNLWLAGGLARFDMMSSVTAALYEERPSGQSPSVTIRGRGRRWHLAAGAARGAFELGAWLATEIDGAGSTEQAFGTLLRLRIGRRDE